MADSEESPAQRQARIRREKREAKIKAGGAERLDKITKLSGRTPEQMRNESPSPSPAATPQTQPTAQPQNPLLASAADPSQAQAQEEYIRAMLRGPEPQESAGAGQGQPDPEDPLMKLLSTITGGAEGMNPDNPGGLPFSPDDISKATGLPPFLTKMLLGQQKPPLTPAQEKATRMWMITHVLFAVLAGLYLLFVVGSLSATFGVNPPPPATVKNPFVVFMMGELILLGLRFTMEAENGPRGFGMSFQLLKEVARDGCIAVFMLGVASWWRGTTA